MSMLDVISYCIVQIPLGVFLASSSNWVLSINPLVILLLNSMGNGIQDLHILCIRLKLPLVVTLICVGNMIWNNRRNVMQTITLMWVTC